MPPFQTAFRLLCIAVLFPPHVFPADKTQADGTQLCLGDTAEPAGRKRAADGKSIKASKLIFFPSAFFLKNRSKNLQIIEKALCF